MTEREIAISAGTHLLAATYCSPDNPDPHSLVLMIHGSGPLDRNENFGRQRLNAFNAIAERLAAVGIASVRYDKRGCGESTGNYFTAGFWDLVTDAIHCVDWVRLSHPDVRLYLLGHSEGCLVAPHAALQRPEVAGLMLLCPFVEPVESVLVRQAEQIETELANMTGAVGVINRVASKLLGSPGALQRKLIDRMRRSTHDTERVALRKFPAKWMRELLELDPEQVFKQLDRPLLLIGGAKDLQCNPEDVSRIAALSPAPVDQRVLPNLTHVLRCDDEPASLLASARLLNEPLEPRVLQLVAEWLQRQV